MKIASQLFTFVVLVSPILHCATRVVPTDAGDRDVIATVLRAVSDEQRCDPCLLETETRGYQPWLAAGGPESATLPADLVAAYAQRNHEQRRLPRDLETDPCRFISGSDVSRSFQFGPREGWDRLRTDFGQRVGLIRISLPAYSASGTAALVTYSFDSGPLAGETNYVVLQKRDGAWRIENSGHLVMS